MSDDWNGGITASQIRALTASLRVAGFDSSDDGKAGARSFIAHLSNKPSLKSLKDLGWNQAKWILDRIAGRTFDGVYQPNVEKLEEMVLEWIAWQADQSGKAVA